MELVIFVAIQKPVYLQNVRIGVSPRELVAGSIEA